jgi:hypothetical protein
MNTNVSSNIAGLQPDRRKAPRVRSKERGWNIFLVVITAILIFGYFFSTQKFYKPGDDVGYNMGLVGGIMLLALLLYPLRKRVRVLRNLGILPTWFKWHMILGILAPALIMFHSTFHIGSINAAMALFAMLLVSGSGIFGRFFYTKIHNGLYGRQATLNELLEDMTKSGNVQSVLSFAPEIEKRLDAFRTHTTNISKGGNAGLWNFTTIGIKAFFLTKSLVKELHYEMYSQAADKNYNLAQLQRLDLMYEENKKQIESYIKAVRDVAQFHTYERLFSWWHIFHIPLVYLLVFSGIYHVISVHMY